MGIRIRVVKLRERGFDQLGFRDTNSLGYNGMTSLLFGGVDNSGSSLENSNEMGSSVGTPEPILPALELGKFLMLHSD